MIKVMIYFKDLRNTSISAMESDSGNRVYIEDGFLVVQIEDEGCEIYHRYKLDNLYKYTTTRLKEKEDAKGK